MKEDSYIPADSGSLYRSLRQAECCEILIEAFIAFYSGFYVLGNKIHVGTLKTALLGVGGDWWLCKLGRLRLPRSQNLEKGKK